MQINRRKFVRNSATFTAGLAVFPDFPLLGETPVTRSSMGVAGASYANRWRSADSSAKIPGFENALQMLMHCESIGAGGAQVGVRDWSTDFSGKVRDFREKQGLYLEGSIALPKDQSDISRFEIDAKNSMEAGVSVLRTACLSGRRYENFETGEEFEAFKKASILSIERAAPILAKHKLKLAIENHKDWKVPDLLSMLKYFDSEWIGVNLDTGNNISFLEDPMFVVESLAPYAFTTHLKDMGVRDYEDGFLMSEVPLGSGALDLKKMIEICRRHNPNIKFNLEMITRNPLRIPYFTEDYWATFGEVRAKKLVGALKWVRDNQSTSELPSIKGMTEEEKLLYEEKNIVDSLVYAKEKLELHQ